MKKYFDLIRIKHWVKNILIFIPLICSKSFSTGNIVNTIICFFALSFACSFVYIINDIKDIEEDKKDPRKKNRPLPSGKIKKSAAIIIAILLLIISFAMVFFVKGSLINYVILSLLSYILINVIYSFGLKNVAVLDVILLASCWVLRVYYGAAIIDVPVSNWLFLTILSFSLYMGIGKRRKELSKGKNVRKVLLKYNDVFLSKYENIFAALMFVFYTLWSIEQPNKYIIFTIFFVIYIFMKYSLILDSGDEGDPTTIIYKDKMLMLMSLIYLIVFGVLIIYG